MSGISATLAEIAGRIGARLLGQDATVTGINTLTQAGSAELALCHDRRLIDQLKNTRAAGVLVPARARVLIEAAPCAVLEVETPREALAQVLEWFYPSPPVIPGIAPEAEVDPQARIHPRARVEAGARIGARSTIGRGTSIGANTILGEDVTVGDDCRISARVVIHHGCALGDRVHLDPGVVIGSPGFGFVSDQKGHRRMPQIGGVVIGDEVEIGANSTIDRGTLGDTRIGRGTKIDNLVQVGHNVVIGEGVLIAAQVGLSGSVTIADGAVLGGQVGVADHISIGPNAQVGAKSGVGSHVPAGARVAGYPAMEVGQWLQSVFRWRRKHGKRRPAEHKEGDK